MALDFEAKPPEGVPDSVAVYELVVPGASERQLALTATRLGLTGKGEFTASDDALTYIEGSAQLEFRLASGALAYADVDKYGVETDRSFELSDERADAIARRLLDRAALAEDDSAELARVTHMHAASADLRTGAVTRTVIDAGVVYRRYVDGLVVEGPGGFAMVNVDAEGAVVGLRAVWRRLGARQTEVKIRPPDEGLDGLRTLAASVRGDMTVVKATFGYFELGPADRQTVLEPAYAYVYTVRNRDVATKSAYVVHAGEKAFGQLQGEKRYAPAGPQRKRSR